MEGPKARSLGISIMVVNKYVPPPEHTKEDMRYSQSSLYGVHSYLLFPKRYAGFPISTRREALFLLKAVVTIRCRHCTRKTGGWEDSVFTHLPFCPTPTNEDILLLWRSSNEEGH